MKSLAATLTLLLVAASTSYAQTTGNYDSTAQVVSKEPRPYFEYELTKKVNGTIECRKYCFCVNQGMVIQLPAANDTMVFGLFRFIPNSNQIQIGWMTNRDGVRFTGEIEAYELLSVSQQPGEQVNVQIVDHSDRNRVGSVMKAVQNRIPEQYLPILAQVANACATNVQLAQLVAEQKSANELRLLLEAHKAMRDSGWTYVEKFGRKLGL